MAKIKMTGKIEGSNHRRYIRTAKQKFQFKVSSLLLTCLAGSYVLAVIASALIHIAYGTDAWFFRGVQLIALLASNILGLGVYNQISKANESRYDR